MHLNVIVDSHFGTPVTLRRAGSPEIVWIDPRRAPASFCLALCLANLQNGGRALCVFSTVKAWMGWAHSDWFPQCSALRKEHFM